MIWELLGKALAAYIGLKLLCLICTFLRSFVFPALGWKTNIRSYGEWAVVTGSTDGIGKGFAFELARQGLKLVLISRSQEKLEAVKKEIIEAHNVEVKTIAFDFSAVSGYEKIEKEIEDLDVGILVNNVGVSYQYPEYFDAYSVDLFQTMLNVNMLSVVRMTHIVLKGMLKKKKGIITHISSGSATKPFPLLTVYSATKIFVEFFARGLQTEYKDQGIISQAIVPFYVATKMSLMKPSLTVPDPASYAQQALQAIGVDDRSTGHWSHMLQDLLMYLIPGRISDIITMNLMSKVRAKVLKKRSKKE